MLKVIENSNLTGNMAEDINILVEQLESLEVFRDLLERYRNGTPACKLCYGFNNNHLDVLDKILS